MLQQLRGCEDKIKANGANGTVIASFKRMPSRKPVILAFDSEIQIWRRGDGFLEKFWSVRNWCRRDVFCHMADTMLASVNLTGTEDRKRELHDKSLKKVYYIILCY